MIDYYKYLKCPECKDTRLYCKPHRIEVTQFLTTIHNPILDFNEDLFLH